MSVTAEGPAGADDSVPEQGELGIRLQVVLMVGQRLPGVTRNALQTNHDAKKRVYMAPLVSGAQPF
ncbi:hypothetical protein N9L68_07780 [bacterium]|nr:hypothetical protein [bacterium]